MSFAYYKHDPSAITNSAGRTNQENHQFDLHFEMNDSWSFGVGHRYDILGEEAIDLQTNGHLHSVFFPIHRESGSGDRGFRFSTAPALSASSNVIKDPSDYSSNTFQLLAALIWSKRLSDQTTIRYGVCGDHRFGQYTVYPSISIDWQPHANWKFELGFPMTRLVFQASKDLSSHLRIAPDGNQWHVRNKDLTKQSRVNYEASLLEWAINWRVREHLMVTASIGRQFSNRYDLTLADDRVVRLSVDSATRIGGALEWRF